MHIILSTKEVLQITEINFIINFNKPSDHYVSIYAEVKRVNEKCNIELLDIFLEPWIGLADDDKKVYAYIINPPQNEQDYRKIIRQQLIKHFNAKQKEIKQTVKISLYFALNDSRIDFEKIFESVLPPFDAPEYARNFFLWIWEELSETVNQTFKNEKNVKERGL